MPHTVLNVVRHQRGGYRLGVICREFQRNTQPAHIIVNGIDNNPIVFHVDNYYRRGGSIVHPVIIDWLGEHFPRTANENIWLLRFEFEIIGNAHVYSYVGPSDFRKVPHRRDLIDGRGNVVHYHSYEELIRLIWDV